MYQTPESLAAYETIFEQLNRLTRRYRVKLWGWLMWHTWGEIYAHANVDDVIEILTIGDTAELHSWRGHQRARR